MKHKILWMLLGFLLVAALVLASCAKEEVVGEQEEEEEPAVGEPQYGGTFTYVLFGVNEAGMADVHDIPWPGSLFLNQTYECLMGADVEKYGPRGNGEYAFGAHSFVPFKYVIGNLVESWDVSTEEIVLHVRPGIYWTGKSINPGVMERREYTAADCAFNINRVWGLPSGEILRILDYIESITATDKYTVVIKLKKFYFEWWGWIGQGYGFQHIPPEVVEAGPREYENVVGTGPFYVKEYLPGSELTLARNLDYWRTTTINGKEYRLPFVDEVVIPMIADESTLIAALRTATLDSYMNVLEPNAASLAKSSPELLKAEVTSGDAWYFALRCDLPPLNNREVRRALMIGTDMDTIFESGLRIGDFYSWPIISASPGHVPLAELPASTRELFEYDPVKAKQMLADAGYPDGFTFDLLVEDELEMRDIAEMLAGMWEEELGVVLDLRIVDHTLTAAALAARNYTSIFAEGYPTLSGMVIEGFYTMGPRNRCLYSDPDFDRLADQAMTMIDPAEREAILEELFVMALDDAGTIPIGTGAQYSCWWPWVKNYYGERNLTTLNPPSAQLSIDQDLKEEMGY